MSEHKFCENCGAALSPGARFCNLCGQPVQAVPESQPDPAQAAPSAAPVPQPAAAPAATAGGEPVYGVIAGAQRRKGLLGHQTFSVMVTPHRLAFVEITPQMQKDTVRQMAEEAKQEGKGLWGRMVVQMGWLNRIVERYSQMPVEQALAENKDNFFILNSHVRKVNVQRRHDSNTHQTTYHLIIEAASGKYSFQLLGGGAEEVRQLLQRTLGAAVK